MDTEDANQIFLTIQPIDSKYTGIWKENEHYFVHRLHQDIDRATQLVELVAKQNSRTFAELFFDHECDYLVSEMAKAGLAQIVTKYINIEPIS